MARSFASASSQYLTNATAWATAEPFTLACWFNPVSATAASVLVSVCDTAANSFFALETGSTNAVIASAVSGGSGVSASTTNRITSGAWNHATAVFSTSGSRTIYCNGFSSTNGLSKTVTGVDASFVGARSNGTSVAVYANGLIAEVAIWSVALTATEANALWRRRSPLAIRPESLVAYYPLGGFWVQADSDVWKSGLDLTAMNSPTWADHAPLFHRPQFGGHRATYVAPPPFKAAWAAQRNARLIGGGVR